MLLNMLLIVVSLGQVWDTTGVIEDPGIHVVELPIVSINIADVVEPYGPRGQNEDAAHREARKQRKSCLPASLLWFR